MDKFLHRLAEIEAFVSGTVAGARGMAAVEHEAASSPAIGAIDAIVASAGEEEVLEEEEEPHLLVYTLEEAGQSGGCNGGSGAGGGLGGGGGADMDGEVWSGLPADMLERVLLMLPLRSQLRFRAVCKRWFSLLSSARFLQQSGSLAFTTGAPICAYQYKPGRLRREAEAKNFFPRDLGPLLGARFKVHSLDLSFVPERMAGWKRGIERCVSQSGLLCIYDADWKRSRICICVINPVSRSWRELPPLAVPGMEDWDIILVAERRVRAGGYKVVVIWNRGCDDASAEDPWYIGVYSSESNAWDTSECEPCLRNLCWRNCVVCDEFLYFVAKSEVRRHRISDGKCAGWTAEPHAGAVAGSAGVGYKDVFLVEQRGAVFWVDFIVPGMAESERTCGLWTLDEAAMRWHQVAVSPKWLIDRLKAPYLEKKNKQNEEASDFRLWLKKVVAAGDYIFLTICLESWAANCCWTHLVAIHLPQLSWQILVYDHVSHPLSDEFYFLEPSPDLVV